MGVGFSSYEIARSGLFVNERGLYVTGHNISNVNTPGYVRQQAVLKNGPYITLQTRYGIQQYGLGSDVQQVRQIRHLFLDNIYRQESTTLGYWETRSKTFQDVQAILAEPMGAGLQNVVNQFWDSWQELSKEPDNLTVRALVRQRGEALVHQINHMGTQLDKLQNDLNSEIGVRIAEVNDITSQIARLNEIILRNEVAGDTAADYRDQRNVLVDRLSKLVSAEVTEMQDGQLDITVGGYFLVTKGTSTNLEAGERNPGDIFIVPKLQGTNIEVTLSNGIIRGLMESRGDVSASKDSVLNGNPKGRMDIVFAVDVSDTSAGYLEKVKANIAQVAEELKNSGADYNLRLITYSNVIVSNEAYGTDAEQLANDIPSVPQPAAGNSFDSVVAGLEGITDFRDGAERFAFVFTNESINGDNGSPVTDASSYIDRLKAINVKTSVVTGTRYYNDGESLDEVGWSAITDHTGGRLYDIETSDADYGVMMERIGLDIDNGSVSLIKETDNIVSDLKRRLNALINVLAREVNHLHRNGVTLDGESGGDFFTVIDDAYPMQMGNIRLNENLSGPNGLNNIVAGNMAEAVGDNTVALKIANLRYNQVLSDASGTLSMDDYYQAIIMNVGRYGSDAERIAGNQLKLVQTADSQRTSIAGVSMDEEMTNMMKYKFAYDASSRVINVMDEMMQTIIERMGLVGR